MNHCPSTHQYAFQKDALHQHWLSDDLACVPGVLSLSLPGEEGHIRLGPLLLLSEFEEYLGWWLCGHVAEAVEVWPTEGGCNLRLPWAPFIPESVLPIPYLLDPASLLGSLHTTASMRPQVWFRPLLENRLQEDSPILFSPCHSECSVALDGSPVLLVKELIGLGVLVHA